MAVRAFGDAALDFAYKYPFSVEAKDVISKSQHKFDIKALGDGKSRVQDALNKSLGFVRIQISSIMLTHLISYVYARMIVSRIGSVNIINKYAESEAHRSAEALLEGDDAELLRVADGLGIGLKARNGMFTIPFEEYISRMPHVERFSLSRQLLRNGIVELNRETVIGFMESPMKNEVLKGLPIPVKELPKEVLEYAKSIKLPVTKSSISSGNTVEKYSWIEKLLENPIPDVRHRTVNLILAPYFTNVRGLPEDDAVKAISDYIDKCRTVNPDTKVNDTYIRYQCRYSKEKGMRPLSRDRARELIGAYVDI